MGFEIIGREDDLAVVDAFIGEAEGGPAALVLEGEAGMGKTTIVRAALGRAAAAGLRVFAARPAAGEAELPYVALGDLLGAVDDATLAVLPLPQRRAMEAALTRGGSSASVDAHALSRGLLELLTRVGAAGDLLVVVDDVQWLDRPTSAALSFALRRLGAVPLRVLVAVRTEGDGVEAPVGVGEWNNVRTVVLGPLPATELGELVRLALGRQLVRPQLEALARDSGGNPMLALELARRGGGDVGPAGRPAILRALEERLVGEDSETRRAVATAAAALRPSVDLLLRSGVARKGLESARSSRLVELDDGRVLFVHPLVAVAAYELLLPDERRDVHARLAAASDDAVERGHHVARSAVGPDDAAAAVLERAAEEAALFGDPGAAAAFLLRANDLAGTLDGERSLRRELAAGDALVAAGDVETAAAIFRGLAERLPRCPERAQARWKLFDCVVGSEMSYDTGLSDLEDALADAEGDAEIQARLHVAIGLIYLGLCRLGEAVEHARTAMRLAEEAGAVGVGVEALAVLGFAESMLGLGVTEASREAFARWDGTTSWFATPRMALASVCLSARRFEEAEELLRQEIAMADERGLEGIEVVARANLAEVQLRAGRWAEALANARRALEHARQSADAQIVSEVTYALALTEASLGRHEEARALASEALAVAESTNDFWSTVSHCAVLGQVALTEADPAGAVEALDRAWALMLESGLGDLSVFPVAQNLGEALVAVGRADDALGVVEMLRGCPVGARPWCRAIADRTEALVRSALGDHPEARRCFAAALEAHADLPEPFEHARTLLLLGRGERRARHWGAARVAFTEALERFDTLGAARWAENAAADLARLPGRRPANKLALTEREREVAELVAAGLANKEVALRLHLSVRTVEANLSHVVREARCALAHRPRREA